MRILPGVACLAVLVLFGCGPSPEPAAKTEAHPAAAPVRDHTAMMPAAGRIGTSLVADHILDQPKFPGGTLGDYESQGKKYQLFIIDAADSQAAAFLLLDAKGMLQNAEYISYMGGYFGDLDNNGKRPVYVFSKRYYLAGVVGLSKEDADPIARVLAARLN